MGEVYKMGNELKLTIKQLELMKRLIRKVGGDKLSLDKVTSSERKGIKRMINRMTPSLSAAGIPIQRSISGDSVWINYSDVHRNGHYDILEPKVEKDLILLEMAPGPEGFGTLAYDPRVGQGLHVFLEKNYPFVLNTQISEDNYLNSLDGVIMVGNFIPDAKRILSSTANAKPDRTLVGLLHPDDVPEERRQRELARMTNLSEMDREDAEEIAEKYQRANAHRKISTEEEMVSYTSRVMHDMFEGYGGPIFAHPGDSELNLEQYLRKTIVDDLKEKRAEIESAQREVNNLLSKIERSEDRMIVKLNLLNITEKSNDYVLKNCSNYGVSSDEMINQPTKQEVRNVLRDLLREFANSYETKTIQTGEIEWDESYFGTLSEDRIDKLKRENSQSLRTEALKIFHKCATYKGLAWWGLIQPEDQRGKAEETKLNSEGQILTQKIVIEDARERLAKLGWMEDKPVKEADITDDILFDILAEQKIQRFYTQVAKGLDFQVLNGGNEEFELGGLTIRTKYEKGLAKGDKLIKYLESGMSNAARRHDHIPDILIMGPSGEMHISEERKYPKEHIDAPLRYERDTETAVLSQLGNMHTSERVEWIRNILSVEDKNMKYFEEASSGQVVIHTEPQEAGVKQDVIIDANSLERISRLEEEILGLEDQYQRARKDNTKDDLRALIDSKKEDLVYKPIMWSLFIEDGHDGESHSFTQNSGPMVLDAIYNYLNGEVENRFIGEEGFTPDLVKFSEIRDGAQRIRGRPINVQHYTINRHKYEKTVENIKAGIEAEIRADNNLGRGENGLWDNALYHRKVAERLAELGRMQTEGSIKPTMSEQDELFGRSGGKGVIERTIENGGVALLCSGDHSNRTTAGLDDEAVSIRNQFHYPVKGGKGELYSDSIKVGTPAEEYGQLTYQDWRNPEMPLIYATHKLGKADGWSVIEGHRETARLITAGHTHHGKTSHKNGQILVISPGQVGEYNYVRNKGLLSGVHGVRIVGLPSETSPYRGCATVISIGDKALEKDTRFKKRMALRREIAENYVPV